MRSLRIVADGVGARVAPDGFNDIPGFAYSAPDEDLTLKTTSAPRGECP